MYLEILKNECLEIVFKSVLKFKSQINFNLSNCKIVSLLNKKKWKFLDERYFKSDY